MKPTRPPLQLTKLEQCEVMFAGVATVDADDWYVFDTEHDTIAVRRDRWPLEEPESNDAWMLTGEFVKHSIAAAEYVVHTGHLTTPTGPLLARYLEAHCALGHPMLCTWLWRKFGVELPRMLDEGFLPMAKAQRAPPHDACLAVDILNRLGMRKSLIRALQSFARAGVCRALATRAFDALGPSCCEQLDTSPPLRRWEDFPAFWQARSPWGNYAAHVSDNLSSPRIRALDYLCGLLRKGNGKRAIIADGSSRHSVRHLVRLVRRATHGNIPCFAIAPAAEIAARLRARYRCDAYLPCDAISIAQQFTTQGIAIIDDACHLSSLKLAALILSLPNIRTIILLAPSHASAHGRARFLCEIQRHVEESKQAGLDVLRHLQRGPLVEPSLAVSSSKKSQKHPVALPMFRASDKTLGISQLPAADDGRMLAAASNLNARVRMWGSSVIVCTSDDLANALNDPLACHGLSPLVHEGDTVKFTSTAPHFVAPLFQLGHVLQVDSPPALRPVGYGGALRTTFALVGIAGETFAVGRHNASDAHVVLATTAGEIHSYCAKSLVVIVDDSNATDLNWFVRVCSRAIKRVILVGPPALLSKASIALRDVFIETTALDHLTSPWEGDHGTRAS